MNRGRRAAASLEVFGVYVVGLFVPGLVLGLLGFQVPNPLQDFTADISDAKLRTAAWQMLVVLLLQYAGYFILIIPINWWHRRRGRVSYGLTRAGRSWSSLVLVGVVTAAIVTWPVLTLNLAQMVWEFGETVTWRQAFFDTSWRRWEFWLFSAVIGFAVVPVLEELFYHGYCQRRLAEDWGDGAAIAGVSGLFVFSHGQYLIPDAYNIAMVVTLLVTAVGFGVVFAWTRSLIPLIIAHAIINVPTRPIWASLVIAILVIGAFLMARRALAIARQVFSNTRVISALTLAVIGAAFGVAASFQVSAVAFIAVGMVLAAVALEARERRAERLRKATG